MKTQAVFVFPPAATSIGEFISSRFDMCLGAAYIISYLRQQEFVVKPFIAPVPLDIKSCVNGILAENPRIVGFTVYEVNYRLCQLIARALKQANPELIIIFGGPTPSVQGKSLLQINSCIDICVGLEGEETCLELFSLLDDKNYDLHRTIPFLNGVNGISFRQGEQIIENRDRDFLIANKGCSNYLDKYPSPYLTGILNSARNGILTARGCNRHCIFCNCAVMSKRVIAYHSIDRVLEELSYISRVFPPLRNDNIAIYDDTFTMERDRALDICHRIIDAGIKLPLVCITRCDTVDEELLETMKTAGFRSIGFALESAVPRVLRIIGKVQPSRCKSDSTFEKEREFIDKFKKYTAYAKKIGISNVFVSIIVGLPGESIEEGQHTVDFIRSLSDDIDYYAHNIFKVYPGTPIFYNYKKYGINLIKREDQIQYRTVHAYDTEKIRLAPKSNIEIDNKKKDRFNLKTLALSVPKEKNTKCFNKIILCTNSISYQLINWLQQCLAVNGPIIQIYSSLEGAKELHFVNLSILEKCLSPSTFHMEYFQTKLSDGTVTLTPYRVLRYGEQCGLITNVIETKFGISTLESEKDPYITMCIDKDEDDVLHLQHLLVCLSESGKKQDNWGNSKVFPYFSSLCRWKINTANCMILDTIIVDDQLNIRTCWNGSPIGRVGMSYTEVFDNVSRIRLEKEKKRNCRRCHKDSKCNKCIFPSPLSDKRYCILQQNFNTGDTAELLQSFEFFKEL